MSMHSELYRCPCGKLFPIDQLYYCSGCQALKCFFCVNEEIVLYSCPTCLENSSSVEVIANRNRCTKCFCCPRCGGSAKMVVEQGTEAYFLRCLGCPWDSRSVAIAPAAADLLLLLREHERAGAESVVFRERLDKLKKSVEDASSYYHKQQAEAKLKKTQQMLAHTPAKSRFFSAKASPLRLNLEQAFESAASQPSSPATPSGGGNAGDSSGAVRRLEQALEKRHDQLFAVPSALRGAATAPPPPPGSGEIAEERGMPTRQSLITYTSKHCNKCDKLLVKPDASASGTLDFKRLHVALLFVVHIQVLALDPVDGAVKLCLVNPMKNAASLVLSPLQAARWSLASPIEISSVAGTSGRYPARQEITFPILRGSAEAAHVMGMSVTLQYEGVLGPQRVVYDVLR